MEGQLVDAAATEQFRRAIEQCALSYCETIRSHVLRQKFRVTIYGVEGDSYRLEATGSQEAILENVLWTTSSNDNLMCDAEGNISLLLRIPSRHNMKQVTVRHLFVASK